MFSYKTKPRKRAQDETVRWIKAECKKLGVPVPRSSHEIQCGCAQSESTMPALGVRQWMHAASVARGRHGTADVWREAGG